MSKHLGSLNTLAGIPVYNPVALVPLLILLLPHSLLCTWAAGHTLELAGLSTQSLPSNSSTTTEDATRAKGAALF